MGKFLNGLRVSAMSVHEGWWYAYLAAFFIQMVGWTLMVALDEAAYGEHVRVVEYLRAVGRDSSHMVQMFILSTIGAIELGRLILVLAENLAKRLKQRRERDMALFKADLIAQGKAEGMAEGRAQGRTEGRAESMAKVAAWNERRLAAEARGERFDEPLPVD